MTEQLKKYIGQCVAVVEGHIVAAGSTRLEAYQKSKKLHPSKRITLRYIPRREETLTFL